jgi:hypothetical protein
MCKGLDGRSLYGGAGAFVHNEDSVGKLRMTNLLSEIHNKGKEHTRWFNQVLYYGDPLSSRKKCLEFSLEIIYE